jgi:hypothetical protein
VEVPDHIVEGGPRLAHLLPIAPPESCTEVGTLEIQREALVRGLKDGFARAWDVLATSEVVEEWGSGAEVAEVVFGHSELSEFEDRWRCLKEKSSPRK